MPRWGMVTPPLSGHTTVLELLDLLVGNYKLSKAAV
jgi:hypothetical protein